MRTRAHIGPPSSIFRYDPVAEWRGCFVDTRRANERSSLKGAKFSLQVTKESAHKLTQHWLAFMRLYYFFMDIIQWRKPFTSAFALVCIVLACWKRWILQGILLWILYCMYWRHAQRFGHSKWLWKGARGSEEKKVCMWEGA